MNQDLVDDDLVDDIEQKIFEARSYVVPSDDLRPRALESAKASSRLMRNVNRLVVATLTYMFFWSILIPVIHALSNLREKSVRTPTEKIESNTNSYSSEPRYEQRYEPDPWERGK